MANRLYNFTPNTPAPAKGGDPRYHQLLEWADKDIIRIYNPLDEAVRYKWDSIPRRVQPHEYQDVYRFLAQKFLDDITEHEINRLYYEEGQHQVELKKKGGTSYIDPQIENREIWDNLKNKYFSATFREKKKLEMAEKCIIGVVRFYNEAEGEDSTIVDDDNVPVSEAIQERMNKPVQVSQEEMMPLVKPNKKQLAKEVTQ